MKFPVLLIGLVFISSAFGEDFRNDTNFELANIKSELKSLSYRLDEEKLKVSILSDRLEKKETEQMILADRISKLEKVESNSNMDFTLQNLGFVAVSDGSHDRIPTGPITYDEVKIGQGLNNDTGVFVAPVDGTYIFFFNAYISQVNQEAEVRVLLNGELDQYLYSNVDISGDNARQLSTFWTMDLKASDEVNLFNYCSDAIFIESYHTMTFMGFLAKF